eukprot:5704009-Amphidinium_carterae.1
MKKDNGGGSDLFKMLEMLRQRNKRKRSRSRSDGDEEEHRDDFVYSLGPDDMPASPGGAESAGGASQDAESQDAEQ